jgi:hypothetical protein
MATLAADETLKGITWYFSWDNPRAHGKVGTDPVTDPGDWAALGIFKRNHSCLPPYAPDMHSVIEQLHHMLKSKMQKEINDNPDGTLAFFIERLEFWFAKLATKDWVQGAIRRLYRDTLPEIVRRGGHWGAHGTR